MRVGPREGEPPPRENRGIDVMLSGGREERERPFRSPSSRGGGDLHGVRVGLDVVAVEEVAESVELLGESYLNRLFTAREVASSRQGRNLVAAQLSACFAAKEATVKVLSPCPDEPIDYRSIEVVTQSSGACQLVLRADAAALAARIGLGDFRVCLTHDVGIAVAIVLAIELD